MHYMFLLRTDAMDERGDTPEDREVYEELPSRAAAVARAVELTDGEAVAGSGWYVDWVYEYASGADALPTASVPVGDWLDRSRTRLTPDVAECHWDEN